MPKFTSRQRKHKVIARSQSKQKSAQNNIDTNILEHGPPARAELEEKKRRIRADLRKAGPEISGQKAKRLEKYIENKLKKDENRDLIARLTKSRTDTSLFQSSKKLGQGWEARHEQVKRILRDQKAGAGDQDGISNAVFHKEELVDQLSSDEEDNEPRSYALDDSDFIPPAEPFEKQLSILSQPTVGTGLKRPLDIDGYGRPLLKKRKLRGGVKSKLSFRSQPPQSPEWEGFNSKSEKSLDRSSVSQDVELIVPDDLEDVHESSCSDGFMTSEDDETEAEASEVSASEDEGIVQKQRSSAFKLWANQYFNEALDHSSTSANTTSLVAPKVLDFRPRAPEEEPLPVELQPTKNVARKAFSVAVARQEHIQDSRLKLPVVAEEQKIMEAVHDNNVVVIYGATGSGKTTQVPQFLFEAGYGSIDSPTPGLIGITQPRRVAAVSMAKRVGDELGDLAKRVAYQIRFEGTVGPETAIKFMTDGVLLREVSQDIALRRYSAIIIDEAHERTVNTDILIGMLSRVVKLRKELASEDTSTKPLKLIIMSATLRIKDFTGNKTLFPLPPPVLQVEGRQYPVAVHFARKTSHDYVEEAFRKISKGHRKLPPGSFLVFLTARNEITHLSKQLKDAFRIGHTVTSPQVRISGKDTPLEAEDVEFGDNADEVHDISDNEVDIEVDDDEDFNVNEEGETGPSKLHILPLYSLLPTREQLRVFERPPEGSRLVVLATNVAETSLTIPGIRYVFDCGRSKERQYDRVTGVQSFEVGWISKASANQRAGRAGRTGPGHCYRLYSSAVYERDFEEHAKPEILRMPIEGVVLQLKAMNLQHVVNFPFPTPPDRQSLASSERLLQYLTALSSQGQVTQIGSTMSIFPLAPRFARILLVGHLHNCLQYTIALVAGLSAAEVFIHENQVVTPAERKEGDTSFNNADRLAEDERAKTRRRFNKVHKEFCFLDDTSDAIKLLQVVGEFAHEPTEAWCQEHYVRFKVLKEILQLRRQITELMRTNIATFAGVRYQEKLDPPSSKQVKALKQMVAAGFIDHVAMRADLASNPEMGRKPRRAIDVPYLTLLPSHTRYDDEDKAVYIHPSSPLAHLSHQECPEYIIYSYLQSAAPSDSSKRSPKTRIHALTDITGNQLSALAKNTPLIQYGKPIKEVMPKAKGMSNNEMRECWVIPYLRAEGTGGLGWPLPARKVIQRKVLGKGWMVE